MAAGEKREDRRILRTRQSLRQGFVEVMREKGFAARSIQDIANRANVNRGTFYIHFADKYVLLDESFVIILSGYWQMRFHPIRNGK